MTVDPLYDEKTLLLQVAEADEKAFRQLYDRYRKKIASFVYLLTESPEMADEIVQEVFVKIWINRDKLQDVHHFNGWIHTITRNFVTDALKKMAAPSSHVIRNGKEVEIPSVELVPGDIFLIQE